MLFVRSLIFNVVFYLSMVICCLIMLPMLALPRAVIAKTALIWVRFNVWMMRVVCGQQIAVVGRENIPQGPYMVACKHQSVWETFVVLMLFPNPILVAKTELFRIPLFGWIIRKCGTIAVDRSAGKRALTAMLKGADEAVANGGQVVIFPEGTRKAPGAEPDYKSGVSFLYAHLKIPCLPVALNSGVFWPRREFLRYPGVFRVELLEPIAPGLKLKPFRARLQNDIETATARLVAIGLRERDGLAAASPPAPEQRPAQ